MRPWEAGRLTREEVFEIYLEPAKDKDEMGDTSRSYRELAFINLRLGGLTWLEAERLWQARPR